MDIKKLHKHGDSDINKEAEELETRIADLIDKGTGLNADLFFDIAEWKLRKQFNRVQRHRNELLKVALPEITYLALCDYHVKTDEELLKFRTKILMTLPSVGIGQASAILGLAFPKDYCVVDYRGWRQLFPKCGKTKKALERTNGTPQMTFTPSDYWRYIQEVRDHAARLKWSVRKTDTAIWTYDKEQKTK